MKTDRWKTTISKRSRRKRKRLLLNTIQQSVEVCAVTSRSLDAKPQASPRNVPGHSRGNNHLPCKSDLSDLGLGIHVPGNEVRLPRQLSRLEKPREKKNIKWSWITKLAWSKINLPIGQKPPDSVFLQVFRLTNGNLSWNGRSLRWSCCLLGCAAPLAAKRRKRRPDWVRTVEFGKLERGCGYEMYAAFDWEHMMVGLMHMKEYERGR